MSAMTRQTVTDVADLMITAIESGGYGCVNYRIVAPPTEIVDGAPTHNNRSEAICRALLGGGAVEVQPREDEGDTEWYPLTLDALMRAASVRGAWMAHGTERFASVENPTIDPTHIRFVVESGDVIDADASVQLAALGEVVYG
jgi:hypothetical protein